MAKKKKKDTKTLKALAIFVLVIGAVYLGLTLGKGAYKSDTITKDNNENNTITKEENVNKGKTDNELGETNSVSEINPEKEIKPEPEVKPESEEKLETEEPKVTDEEKDIDEENSSEQEDIKEENKETPQGSGTEDNFDMNVDASTLSNKGYSWSFKRNKEHKKVTGYNKFDIEQYEGYYIVDTDEKVIYLTFDEGYENGYTPAILDTLKANDVEATFFVTKPFIKNNVELAKRMKDEGHIVGNHTVHHKRMYELTDDEIKYEIEETARYFEEMTGYKMDTFFRPPEGAYSERSLCLTRQLGYKTIFWSMAYADWDRNNQKGKEYAYNHVINNAHPGMISLLHAVSSSNTEALNDIIKTLKEQGYRFGNLYEIE
ncbi:delta-lactam-biosynthetic de-N-acetylase [Vallitalea sp.]|jgi:peptidoglycan-N-acetylmuramic acid deacetylase|uniref:delta-lactam-biosynthetic de-N-acetylase n=1 Tax=Vallitalea sp. TaxID=1882829 RepID=UPI0025F778EC|nr:delta-lactam-biosynthetic de-N-acetylase [Vallitalea sp.]MCT4685756.1 delta-lactam-biosynthetic de-N-acetylase [Vallitalea sp.]